MKEAKRHNHMDIINKFHGRSITPEQLAARWKCSSNTVRNMISNGKLSSFRIGTKLIRIPISQIEEYEKCAS